MSRLTSRRQLLAAAAMATPLIACPGIGLAAVGCPRRLRFHHLHTGEQLDIVYCENGHYLPDALGEVNQLLRDFRSGEMAEIDPALLDLLHAVQASTGADGTFEIISGYRSPSTNEMLRSRSRGVARRSLHMQGKAVDVRLPGLATRQLRNASVALRRGGVGYYPADDFVHLDTGRVRTW